MNLPNPRVDAKFIVEVEHVKEVTVTAEADWTYWREYLKPQALFPFNNNGKATIILSATELRSMGKRANELTIGLVVCEHPEADSPNALFLLHAFNSSSLFAWIERTIFSTPYFPGRIYVNHLLPASIQLVDRSGPVVDIRMGMKTAPTLTQDELWQGKIYLPSRQASSPQNSKYFVAKLAGQTQIYPFAPTESTCQVWARQEHPVFQRLLDSNTVWTEWRIRADAIHARSKTFRAI